MKEMEKIEKGVKELIEREKKEMQEAVLNFFEKYYSRERIIVDVSPYPYNYTIEILLKTEDVGTALCAVFCHNYSVKTGMSGGSDCPEHIVQCIEHYEQFTDFFKAVLEWYDSGKAFKSIRRLYLINQALREKKRDK